VNKTQLILNNTINKGKDGLKRLFESSFDGYNCNLNLLFKLLDENKDTVIGKKYGFSDIKTYEEYVKKVPLTVFDDYREYIKRIEDGEKNILSARDTVHFALSSGSSGNPKKVPMCQEACDLFALYTHGTCFAVMDRELGDEWKKSRGVSLTEIRFRTYENGFTYGAVSGKVREKHKENEGNVYTSPIFVSYPQYEMNFMYMHLRFALMERDMSYITCTFMTSLYDTIRFLENNWKIVVEDIKNGTINENIKVPDEIRKKSLEILKPDEERALELEKEFEKGFKDIMPRIWKKLSFVFGIGSESFRIYTERLRYFLGDVKVHYSVFSASEGIFGCPISSESDEMVLIPFSAFYEFKEVGKESIVTMDKLEKGKKYELIITNLSGFYRYRMMDVIEVTGFLNKLPKVRFLYRLNQVLNIAGEKTNDSMMKDVMMIFEKRTGIKIKEYTIYADTNTSPGRYVLFMEWEERISKEEAENMSLLIDSILCEINSSYGDKIRNGKLKNLMAVPLEKGTYNKYTDIMKEKGVSVNQLKPVRVCDTLEKKEFFIEHRMEKKTCVCDTQCKHIC